MHEGQYFQVRALPDLMWLSRANAYNDGPEDNLKHFSTKAEKCQCVIGPCTAAVFDLSVTFKLHGQESSKKVDFVRGCMILPHHA